MSSPAFHLYSTPHPSTRERHTPAGGLLSVQPGPDVGAVERLAGNVGYLELRVFRDGDACARILEAMTTLSDTSALIVDLRRAGGGGRGMGALLASCLFDTEPAHLTEVYEPTPMARTRVALPSRTRYLGRDVYLLIGRETSGAAEALARGLASTGRAVLVGEPTRSGVSPTLLAPADRAREVALREIAM
ncbi:MAG: S41 family peptidase [Gemmatimonadota bacterium]|nr:S41 family peptidase [Gemmatimonadota bacterium]